MNNAHASGHQAPQTSHFTFAKASRIYDRIASQSAQLLAYLVISTHKLAQELFG